MYMTHDTWHIYEQTISVKKNLWFVNTLVWTAIRPLHLNGYETSMSVGRTIMAMDYWLSGLQSYTVVHV